jgi:glycosyltransferase involved in cell wall biosynthesis
MPDGKPWPKVSIVTPSYNQAKFIEETIRSVLLQSYPNLEYIVIDGGSTDNSVEIIKKYEKWLTYWVSEPDRGQSHALNKGFEKASGEIYAWLNSDDYFFKHALMNVAAACRSSPNSGGWFGGCRLVDVSGNGLGTRWPNRLDLEGIADWSKNHFGQPACFFSQKAWQECGPLEEGLHYEMDFDLWLKIAKAFSIEKVNDVLAAAYIHRDAKTYQGNVGHVYAEQFLIQVRHGYERLAAKDIGERINDYVESLMKVKRISQFPLLRPFMPIARMIWKRLL